ncbi:unnamed protein product [Prunus brigantina]
MKVGDMRKIQVSELDQLRNLAYENGKIYKEKTKLYHYKAIQLYTGYFGLSKIRLGEGFIPNLTFIIIRLFMPITNFWDVEVGLH